MHKHIEALVQYILRLFFLFGIVVGGGAVATGCANLPSQPVVVTKVVAIVPADNLLLDCDVAAPPAKAVYLRREQATTTIPNLTIGVAQYPYTERYVHEMLKTAQERERQLTSLNLKHYENVDRCNQRWKQLREWKIKALREANAAAKQE